MTLSDRNTQHSTRSIRSLLDADADAPDSHQQPRASAEALPNDVVPAPPPTPFDPALAGLGASLPSDVALLCVTNAVSTDGPALSLNWHRAGATDSAPHEPLMPELPVHNISLASLAAEAGSAPKEATPWQDVYYEMMSCWAAQHQLLYWIAQLMAKSRPRLIVWDNTAHNIPWELVYYDPPRDNPGWLGAMIPVIRWTSVQDGEKAGRLPLQQKTASEGTLLVLQDESLRAPKDIFRPYLAEPAFSKLDDLLRRLDQPADGLGMLMIRCHGIYGPDARSFTLGGLSLNRLTGFPMSTLRDAGTPVLLNACSSGRIIQDMRGIGKPVRSFVEFFLRKGAGAVIAVSGDIDVDHSDDFAFRLLKAAEREPTNLAELLQQHRSHYANETREPTAGEKDERTEEHYQRFFAAFLYLFYGHPDATVRMRQPGEVGI